MTDGASPRLKSLSPLRIDLARKNWRKVKLIMKLDNIVSHLKIFAEEREERRYTSHNYTEISVKKCCVIPQNSVTKACFDFCASIAYLCTCFSIPYFVFFHNGSASQYQSPADVLFDVIIAIDFLLNFAPVFFSEVVFDFKNLTSEKMGYLASLMPDLLSLIPFFLLHQSLVWFRLLRLLRINALIYWIEESVITKHFLTEVLVKDEYMRKTVVKLLKFMLLVGITCHCIACMWYYITTVEDSDITWMSGAFYDEDSKYMGSSNRDKYMASLYWTTVTFTSVGYGDIVPKSIPEYIYAMIIEFLGIMFFAYLMGHVNTYISNIDKKHEALKKRENDLDKWIFDLDSSYPDKVMPSSIYEGIRDYYKFQWENDDSSIENFNKFMLKLPSHLRHEMNQYLYKTRIEFLGAFIVGVTDNTVYELAVNIKPRYEGKAVELIKKGTRSKYFYVIKSGSIVIIDDAPFLKLNQKSYFGEISVIFKEKSDFGYITDGETSLLTVHRNVFEKIAKYDLRILAVRAFRRNKYFNMAKEKSKMHDLDRKYDKEIEEFNIFHDRLDDDEAEEFERKTTKYLVNYETKADKYLNKIKLIQEEQFETIARLQKDLGRIKLNRPNRPSL